MNLDKRQMNLVKSLILAIISLVLVVAAYSYFIWPIENSYREDWLMKCFDNIDGQWVEKEGISCSVRHGGEIIPIALGAISFLVFVASMNYFEKKRLHNWRSWK